MIRHASKLSFTAESRARLMEQRRWPFDEDTYPVGALGSSLYLNCVGLHLKIGQSAY